MDRLEQPWSSPPTEVLESLDVDAARGLAADEVRRRLADIGPNILETAKPRSAWLIFVGQFQSLVVLLLVVAALAAFSFGEFVEAVSIAAVIAINAALGFFMELRAVRSMEALRSMAQNVARVCRDGGEAMVAARELVPGDIVEVQAGDVVSADMRIVDDQNLQVGEAVLTGESVPVDKSAQAVAADTELADRTNMLFKGTAVTRGEAVAVVTATGMATELGRITELVQQAQQGDTPLEKRLDVLARKLLWVCLVLAGLIAVIGLVQQKPTLDVIETAIALAVATIPEGLPIVATIALARGMWRMSRRHALVRNLGAVETLGSTSVILTDKTGTLTENRMTVAAYATPCSSPSVEVDAGEARFQHEGQRVALDGDRCLRAALEIGVLCNGAQRADERDPQSAWVGDPVEVSLLDVARAAGVSRAELLDACPETREEPFDAGVKMMATFHRQHDGRVRVAAKGAPEAILTASTRVMTPQGSSEALSEAARQQWLARGEELAASGLRVLALAEKWVDSDAAAPYEELVFVGLVGFVDPPRADVRAALDACQQAGIRVVMITGDHPATALHIARELGMADAQSAAMTGAELRQHDTDDAARARLLESPVYARVSPEQKLDLVELHKSGGAVVAMTGDGVNDAPALTRADIGIAMGQRGTQVAREASDMVLQDDSFATIVVAIEQGRVIFENIRKFVVYLLSCNISELFVVAIASLFFSHVPLPITPLQILFLNLVTDVFPALALGLGEGERNLLARAPRDPQTPVITGRDWGRIFGWGTVITVIVLGVYLLALDEFAASPATAVTMSFLTLALAQLWHVFNMRGRGAHRLVNDISRNPWVWGALVLCMLLLLAAVYIRPLAELLSVTPPTPREWSVVFAAGLLPAVLGLARK